MESWLSILLVAIVLLVVFMANPFGGNASPGGTSVNRHMGGRSGGGGKCSSDTCGI